MGGTPASAGQPATDDEPAIVRSLAVQLKRALGG